MDAPSHKGIYARVTHAVRGGVIVFGFDQNLSFVINRTEDNYSSRGQIGKGVGDPLFFSFNLFIFSFSATFL